MRGWERREVDFACFARRLAEETYPVQRFWRQTVRNDLPTAVCDDNRRQLEDSQDLRLLNQLRER